MVMSDKIIGLPWQLAEKSLQAASISYEVKWGQNYNKFFDIADTGAYVARIKYNDLTNIYEVLLYRPMFNSNFNSGEILCLTSYIKTL